LENAEDALGSGFRNEGELIVLLDGAGASFSGAGASKKEQDEFASSEYAKTIYNVIAGSCPSIDLAAEKRLIDCLVKLASEHAIQSAHDISDGGIAVTLAESCFTSDRELAADVSFGASEKLPAEIILFGERGARAVVSLAPGSLARVSEIAAQYNVTAARIGTVIRGEFRIQYEGAPVIQGSVDSFGRIWKDSLGEALESA
jgi:phosphoribosylformylglycinamidine synthase